MKKQGMFFLLFLNVTLPGFSQTVSFGVKGGLELTRQTFPPEESRPYIVGPSVEVALPAGFAIEVDALYHRVGNSASFNTPPAVIASGSGLLQNPSLVSFANRLRGNAWEFPFIGKYYFRPRNTGWQPYLGTGWALRTVGVRADGNETVLDANGALNSISYHNHFRSPLGVGATFAAGVRIHAAGRFAVVPEVRYTHWGNSDNLNVKNEAVFSLGLTF
jgi:hypothetical protein